MMKPYTKHIRLYVATALFIALGVVLAGVFERTAFAWCDSSQTDYARCSAENFDSIPDKRGVDITKFNNMVKQCTKGKASGYDGFTDADCANAASLCIQKAINLSDCTPNNMADMANWCNDGKGTDSESCSRLSEINTAAFDKAKQDAIDQAQKSCSVSGSEANKVDQKKACADKLSSCSQPTGIAQQKRFNEYGFDDYNKCLNSALKTGSKDATECAARGGIWVDKANEGNGLKQGCQNQYSDLVNPQACAASGGANRSTGVWAQEAGKTGNDGWGCHDPNEVCNKPDQWKINDTSPCTKENQDKNRNQDPNKIADGPGCRASVASNNNNDSNCIKGATNQCGTSETNIIGCSGKGGQAIGDVLKIFVMVLSFGVGIAAVGGLAYSAIQYAGASDNESHVSAAKERIRNIIIGLLLYGFLLVIVNWLLPGGIFS